MLSETCDTVRVPYDLSRRAEVRTSSVANDLVEYSRNTSRFRTRDLNTASRCNDVSISRVNVMRVYTLRAQISSFPPAAIFHSVASFQESQHPILIKLEFIAIIVERDIIRCN